MIIAHHYQHHFHHHCQHDRNLVMLNHNQHKSHPSNQIAVSGACKGPLGNHFIRVNHTSVCFLCVLVGVFDTYVRCSVMVTMVRVGLGLEGHYTHTCTLFNHLLAVRQRSREKFNPMLVLYGVFLCAQHPKDLHGTE